MKNLIFVFFVLFILFSCDTTQSKLENTETEIEYIEQNEEDMTAKDWFALEKKMQELESDLEQNRDKYTDEQVKEIGKLQGRYAALILKKEIRDLQESINDFGHQMEGFVEGFKPELEKK